MSTYLANLTPRANLIADLVATNDAAFSPTLRGLIFGSHDEESLLRPESLAERLTLLDELDSMGDLDHDIFPGSFHPEIVSRAKALKSRLEAANEKLFHGARSEIAAEGDAPMLRRWLMELEGGESSQGPRPGLGFDWLDEIVSGVFKLGEPGEAKLPISPEMTFYQPTPVRHILDLIRSSNLSADDLLVDLGSGLGHVPLLVSILTGSRTLGVEIQPAYVAIAREAARNLNLRSVQFVTDDARLAELASGTVFYLFTPFTGSLLKDVVDRLREESRMRRIRICSLGPSTHSLQEQPWLRARSQPETERIAVFESR